MCVYQIIQQWNIVFLIPGRRIAECEIYLLIAKVIDSYSYVTLVQYKRILTRNNTKCCFCIGKVELY